LMELRDIEYGYIEYIRLKDRTYKDAVLDDQFNSRKD
jgi:hypothetical protein